MTAAMFEIGDFRPRSGTVQISCNSGRFADQGK